MTDNQEAARLVLPRLIVGLWGITGGDMWGPQDEADSIRAIHAAIDHGLTAFDTAEGYGNGYSEEVLGKALSEVARGSTYVLTKVSEKKLRPEDLSAACEKSLKRLGTDYIDLYQVHWPNPAIPLSETTGALEHLVETGKIRAYGVSNFGPTDLAELYQVGGAPRTNQLAYSLLFRAVEFEIANILKDKGTGIIAYSALLHGILTGKFPDLASVPDGRARTRHFSPERSGTRHGSQGHEQETHRALEAIRSVCSDAGISMREAALHWVLTRDGVDAALIGVRNAEQAAQNARILHETPDASVMESLSDATAPLKEAMGPHADMWTLGKRIR